MSRDVRKTDCFCICENKDADQLRGNREAGQRLCFRYTDSTIPLLPKSEISSPIAIFSDCLARFAFGPGQKKKKTKKKRKSVFLERGSLNTILIMQGVQCRMVLVVNISIMKTCPCNEHPLTPRFYIGKLGLTGVCIISLFLL